MASDGTAVGAAGTGCAGGCGTGAAEEGGAWMGGATGLGRPCARAATVKPSDTNAMIVRMVAWRLMTQL